MNTILSAVPPPCAPPCGDVSPTARRRRRTAPKRLLGRLGAACALAAALWPGVPSRADSLWPRRVQSRAMLFVDNPQYEIGDLVTIVISEATDVDTQEQRALSKDGEAAGAVDFSAASAGGFGPQAADLQVDGRNSSNRGFDGSAAFRSSREFADRVAATVQDVLPNGNLVLIGERRILIDGDERTLTVSGIIRRQDVRPDGTINSRYVSDLRVRYTGQGDSQSYLRQGWLSRSLNRMWPF